PKPSDSNEREFNKDTYSLNIRNSFKYIDTHNIVSGLNLEFQENTINGWGFLIPEYNRFMFGAFIYDQFEIHPDLHFLGGIRYDHGFMDTKSYYDWYPSTLPNSDGSTSYVYLQRARDRKLDFGNISAST